MGILFNAFNFIYYTTEGYGTAASTRVANGKIPPPLVPRPLPIYHQMHPFA